MVSVGQAATLFARLTIRREKLCAWWQSVRGLDHPISERDQDHHPQMGLSPSEAGAMSSFPIQYDSGCETTWRVDLSNFCFVFGTSETHFFSIWIRSPKNGFSSCGNSSIAMLLYSSCKTVSCVSERFCVRPYRTHTFSPVKTYTSC